MVGLIQYVVRGRADGSGWSYMPAEVDFENLDLIPLSRAMRYTDRLAAERLAELLAGMLAFTLPPGVTIEVEVLSAEDAQDES